MPLGHTTHPAAHKTWWLRATGLRIRQARHDAGMTLRQLAETIGKSVSHIQKWEDGVTSVPSYDLTRIEVALGCNHYDLTPDESDWEKGNAA